MIIAHSAVWVDVRQLAIAMKAVMVPSCGLRLSGPADKTALRTGNAAYWLKCLQRTGKWCKIGSRMSVRRGKCSVTLGTHWKQAKLGIVLRTDSELNVHIAFRYS